MTCFPKFHQREGRFSGEKNSKLKMDAVTLVPCITDYKIIGKLFGKGVMKIQKCLPYFFHDTL